MINTQTSVSAILPVRNSIRWLNNIEATILPSLRNCDELIIVDDNSNDGTLDQLFKLGKKHANIRISRNPGQGLCDALNHGIKISSSELIARYDIDDIYSKTRIIDQLNSLKKDAVAIFTDYEIFAENKQLGLVLSPIFPLQTAISLVNSERTAHPSVLFRKSAVMEVGGYVGEDFPAEDLSLWLRLLKIGELHSIGITELKWRLHKNSTSNKHQKKIIEKTNSLLFSNQEIANASKKILDDFEFYFLQYKNNSKSIRQILFLRDFLRAQRILGGNGVQKSILKYAFRAFKEEKIEFVTGSSGIFISKIRRDIWRHQSLKDQKHRVIL